MKYQSIAIGTFAAVTVVSGSLWAAQEYSKEQIEDSLRAYAQSLPDGHKLTFEGLDYNLATDELSIEKLGYSWPEINTSEEWHPAGQLSFTGLIVTDPNLDAFLSTPADGEEVIARYLKWRQIEFSRTGQLDYSGTDGVMSNPSLNITEAKNSALPQILNSFGATGLRVDRSRYSFSKTQIDGSAIQISGITKKLQVTGIDANSVASWSSGETTMDFNGKKAQDGKDFSGSGKLDSLLIENWKTDEVNSGQNLLSDYSLVWQSNPPLYQVLTQFSQSLHDDQEKNIRYDLLEVSGIKLNFLNPEDPGAAKIPVRIGHIKLKDVTPSTTGLLKFADIDFSIPEEDLSVSIADISGTDLDVRSLPGFIEDLRARGDADMEARLAEKGFLDLVPSFNLGTFSASGLNIQTPEDIIEIGKVGFFDLIKEETGQLSAGFDLEELVVPAKWIGKKEQQLADMLTAQGHQQLTLNARLDLAHNPDAKDLAIEEVKLATKELGGAHFSALLSNFQIPANKASATMTGMFSQVDNAQFTFADKGMISLLAQLIVPTEPGQTPNSQELLQAAIEAKRQQSSSQTRIDFFKALGGLAKNSGELQLIAKPAKPVAIAEIMMVSNQGGAEAVLDLLNVKSSHKP